MRHTSLGLGLALVLPWGVTAQDLFGQGLDGDLGLSAPKNDRAVEVAAVPNAHWNFQPDADGSHWKVDHYSPNLDGLGFDNQSKCYGHTLLSTRWFQYIVKPLKNGTLTRITPEEFRDFWGGHMTYPPSYDITSANVDGERLQPYSVYNESARVAVGRLVGYYYSYQNNLFDHGDTMYDSAERFCTTLVNKLHQNQLPNLLTLRRSGGAHSVDAYRVDRGTAMFGNTAGGAGTRKQAYRIRFYDPNEPGNGRAADDEAYGARSFMIVFEDGAGFVGLSERNEYWYSRYLRQADANPAGTWHIPDGKYGIDDDIEDDDGEIRSWHWSSVDDAEAREIAGLD